jgi:hypothetical protein
VADHVKRNEQSGIHTWLHDVMRTSTQIQTDNVEALHQVKTEIVELAETHRRAFDSNKVDMAENTDLILQSVLGALHSVNEKGSDFARCQNILASLTFEQMPMRHFNIPETYADTFAWVLEDYPFRPWLEGSDGTFWIEGKPGSGKSTMMKMLSESPLTRDILNTWSGVNRLVTTSVFFWSSGVPMQRSLLGFLQSLLHQVLRHFPEQVPVLCPRRWRESSWPGKFDPWTKSELLETLKTIIANHDLEARYCFFIDGLDECEGEHHELVQTLAEINDPQLVKMCVSSRNRNVFRKAFGQSPEHRLVLQDLTKKDMDRYIRDQLEANVLFQALAATDPSAQLFPQEIRKRAQGVFLWVFIVVGSLIRGLTEDDDMDVLRARFREIPDDLEEYFMRMIGAVDKVYDRFMARSLLLACTAETPLPLPSYYYVDIDHRNPSFAMQAAQEPYDHGEILVMKDNMVSLISKWCRDLLEITAGQVPSDSTPDPIFQFQVGFLHRTVRDFLITSAMQTNLKARAGSDFRPEATLSRIFLVHAKRVPRPGQHCASEGSNFQYAAGNMMYYIRKHEVRYEETMSDLVHELDRVGNEIYPPSNTTTWAGQPLSKNFPIASRTSSSWSPIWDEDKQPAPGDMVSSRMHRERDLIAFAVEFDLQIFVRETLRHDRRRIDESGRTPLLYHALSAVAPSELGLPSNGTPNAMVGLLLGMNANINISTSRPNATLWRMFLHSISASKFSTTIAFFEASSPQKIVVVDNTVHEDDSPDHRLCVSLPHRESLTSPDSSSGTVSRVQVRSSGRSNDICLEDYLEHDSAIGWHFSALRDICWNLCRGTQSNSRLVIPQHDASLLELMLHHGARPDQMEPRVLHALLRQCCGECQSRFTSCTSRDSTWLSGRHKQTTRATFLSFLSFLSWVGTGILLSLHSLLIDIMLTIFRFLIIVSRSVPKRKISGWQLG